MGGVSAHGRGWNEMSSKGLSQPRLATHLGRKTGFWARCSRSSGEVESELTYRST